MLKPIWIQLFDVMVLKGNTYIIQGKFVITWYTHY